MVPHWAIQRLEESQTEALGRLLEYANGSDDDSRINGGDDVLGALTTEVSALSHQRQQSTATQQRMCQAAVALQYALDDATRAQEQVGLVKSLPASSIDSVIASAERENEDQVGQRTWRRNLQLQMLPPAKRACV